jgi:hypothetical protein
MTRRRNNLRYELPAERSDERRGIRIISPYELHAEDPMSGEEYASSHHMSYTLKIR